MVLERLGRGGAVDDAMSVYETLDREIARVLPELAAFAAGDGPAKATAAPHTPGDRSEESPG